MEQLLSANLIQQLLDSDIMMELSVASLLKQYQNYLLASQNIHLPVHTSIPKILVCLSTIQKFHHEKLRIYYNLSQREFHKCVSHQLLEDLEKIEYQVKGTIEQMTDLLLHQYSSSSLRFYFDELHHIYSNKKKFLNTMLKCPAEPWISPYVKQLYRF